MSNYYPNDYERRSYAPTDYEPSRGRDYEREAPYDTLYRRSFDPNVPTSPTIDTRLAPYNSPGSGNRPRSASRSRYYGYEDNSLSPVTSHQRRHHSARPRSPSRSRSRSRSRDIDYDRQLDRRQSSQSRPRSRGAQSRYHDDEPEITGHFGKDRKDMAATVVGAVVGGFLGHEADKRKGGGMHNGVATLGGAVLGGLAGNAIEHHHLKREQSRRREREHEYEREHDDGDYRY